MIPHLYLLALKFSAAFIDKSDVNLPNQNPGRNFVRNRFQSGLEIAFGALGAISVLMIMIAAMQYVMSGGDSAKIGKAKNTIIYALVGLFVAIFASAIVQFVFEGVFA